MYSFLKEEKMFYLIFDKYLYNLTFNILKYINN